MCIAASKQNLGKQEHRSLMIFYKHSQGKQFCPITLTVLSTSQIEVPAQRILALIVCAYAYSGSLKGFYVFHTDLNIYASEYTD